MARVINVILVLVLFTVVISAQAEQQEELPKSVKEFLFSDEQAPFGTPHPNAHNEIKDFNKLTGVWLCTTHAFFQGQWYSGWPAYWTFKYALDGFAIEDLWYQLKENLSPPLKYLDRNYAGINIRIYDYAKEKVVVFWAANSTPNTKPTSATSSFEGNFDDGIFKMMKSDSTRRVTFSNITENTFDWMAENYIDSTATWQPTLKISGQKIK